MKTYKAYTIQDNSEILVGLLSQYPFESFEEHDDHMIAYIPEDVCDDEIALDIKTTLLQQGVAYEVSIIEPQNWNALWEASFEPVTVDDFCEVRADFHPVNPAVKHDIIINPKMAFGTGHHETTYMMMSAMREIRLVGKNIFDYGCGTGVLAILASKLGATHIDAIDIEEESYDNTIENAEINAVQNIAVGCATLDSWPPKTYDVILANINRQVLLDSSDELFRRLSDNGDLLLSGILEDDVTLVRTCYEDAGFALIAEHSRGYWKCLLMTKK